MTLVEQVQNQLRQLPPEKQSEVLDFISFLRQQQTSAHQRAQQHSMRQHAAFGSWCGRRTDALRYQHHLRSEWDKRA